MRCLSAGHRGKTACRTARPGPRECFIHLVERRARQANGRPRVVASSMACDADAWNGFRALTVKQRLCIRHEVVHEVASCGGGKHDEFDGRVIYPGRGGKVGWKVETHHSHDCNRVRVILGISDGGSY